MTPRFRKYSWQLAPASIRDIRQRVFIDEQKVPPELEWDDTDEIADHYLAVDHGNTPMATARLFSTMEETGFIGRMAVLPEYRGQGVGEALLRHLVAESAGRFQELRLSAQNHATGFYERFGFVRVGAVVLGREENLVGGACGRAFVRRAVDGVERCELGGDVRRRHERRALRNALLCDRRVHRFIPHPS